MKKRCYITFVNSVTGDYHSQSYMLDGREKQIAAEWLREAGTDGIIEKAELTEIPDLSMRGLDALSEELGEQRELAAGGAL
jgi:hypothetical protein